MLISKRQRQWIKSANPNRGILIFCGIYAVIAAPLLIWSMFINDFKGAVVIQQLALIPIGILAAIPGVAQFLAQCIGEYSWLNNIYMGFLLSVSILYVSSHLVCWPLIVLASFEAMRWPEES